MARRTTLAAILIFAVGLAAISWDTRAAEAGDVWCWDDPIIQIGNDTVGINIGVRRADLRRVQGAEIVVYVPEGVPARVVHIETTYFVPTVRLVPVPQPVAAANGVNVSGSRGRGSSNQGAGSGNDHDSGAAPNGKPHTVTIRATVNLRAHGNLDYLLTVSKGLGRNLISTQSAAEANEPETVQFTVDVS